MNKPLTEEHDAVTLRSAATTSAQKKVLVARCRVTRLPLFIRPYYILDMQAIQVCGRTVGFVPFFLWKALFHGTSVVIVLLNLESLRF